MIRKFRKKPVVIEAIQYTEENKYKIIDFVKSLLWFKEGYFIIPTLEGDLKAEKGDWIIKGIKGEFYPCKPDIFAKSYDEVK